MILNNGAALFEMFNNYKEIEPGVYYGQVQKVFVDRSNKNKLRLNFIIEYFDTSKGEVKLLNTIYNMAGSSGTYLLSQLIPVLAYYGIEVNFGMEFRHIFNKCSELVDKAVIFNVEQTSSNKNIRLICPTDVHRYMQ